MKWLAFPVLVGGIILGAMATMPTGQKYLQQLDIPTGLSCVAGMIMVFFAIAVHVVFERPSAEIESVAERSDKSGALSAFAILFIICLLILLYVILEPIFLLANSGG